MIAKSELKVVYKYKLKKLHNTTYNRFLVTQWAKSQKKQSVGSTALCLDLGFFSSIGF